MSYRTSQQRGPSDSTQPSGQGSVTTHCRALTPLPLNAAAHEARNKQRPAMCAAPLLIPSLAGPWRQQQQQQQRNDNHFPGDLQQFGDKSDLPQPACVPPSQTTYSSYDLASWLQAAPEPAGEARTNWHVMRALDTVTAEPAAAAPAGWVPSPVVTQGHAAQLDALAAAVRQTLQLEKQATPRYPAAHAIPCAEPAADPMEEDDPLTHPAGRSLLQQLQIQHKLQHKLLQVRCSGRPTCAACMAVGGGTSGGELWPDEKRSVTVDLMFAALSPEAKQAAEGTLDIIATAADANVMMPQAQSFHHQHTQVVLADSTSARQLIEMLCPAVAALLVFKPQQAAAVLHDLPIVMDDSSGPSPQWVQLPGQQLCEAQLLCSSGIKAAVSTVTQDPDWQQHINAGLYRQMAAPGDVHGAAAAAGNAVPQAGSGRLLGWFLSAHEQFVQHMAVPVVYTCMGTGPSPSAHFRHVIHQRVKLAELLLLAYNLLERGHVLLQQQQQQPAVQQSSGNGAEESAAAGFAAPQQCLQLVFRSLTDVEQAAAWAALAAAAYAADCATFVQGPLVCDRWLASASAANTLLHQFCPAIAALLSLTPQTAGGLHNLPVQLDDPSTWPWQHVPGAPLQPAQLLTRSGLAAACVPLKGCGSTVQAALQAAVEEAAPADDSSMPGSGLLGFFVKAQQVLQQEVQADVVQPAGSILPASDFFRLLMLSRVHLAELLVLVYSLLKQGPSTKLTEPEAPAVAPTVAVLPAAGSGCRNNSAFASPVPIKMETAPGGAAGVEADDDECDLQVLLGLLDEADDSAPSKAPTGAATPPAVKAAPASQANSKKPLLRFLKPEEQEEEGGQVPIEEVLKEAHTAMGRALAQYVAVRDGVPFYPQPFRPGYVQPAGGKSPSPQAAAPPGGDGDSEANNVSDGEANNGTADEEGVEPEGPSKKRPGKTTRGKRAGTKKGISDKNKAIRALQNGVDELRRRMEGAQGEQLEELQLQHTAASAVLFAEQAVLIQMRRKLAEKQHKAQAVKDARPRHS